MKEKFTLREARENLGITQQELAEMLGITRTYVGLVENGSKPFSEKLKRKLLKVAPSGEPHAIGPPASVVPGMIAEVSAEGYGKPDNWAELFKRLERIETDLALIKKLLTMK